MKLPTPIASLFPVYVDEYLNYTVMDLLGRMNEEDRKKVYLLSDCASPVTGFENAAVEFQENMKKVGAHVIKFEEVNNIFK